MDAKTRSLHLYLIIGMAMVVVTPKKQTTADDVIWYPVDEEDGVFISLYGEKFSSKWEDDIKRTRMILDHFHDPFFSTTPSSKRRAHSSPRRPKRQMLFGTFHPWNFHSPANPLPPFQPNDLQPVQFSNPFTGFNSNGGFSKSIGRPIASSGNQWPTISNQINSPEVPFWTNSRPRPNEGVRPTFSPPFQNPGPSFQMENNLRPTSNSGSRPNLNGFFFDDKRPLNQGGLSRPPNNGGPLLFPEDATRPTNPPKPPTTPASEPEDMSACEKNCPVTPEFNPVCGTNSVTYSNIGRLKCAQNCGKVVGVMHHGNCRSSRLSMPPRWTRSRASDGFLHF